MSLRLVKVSNLENLKSLCNQLLCKVTIMIRNVDSTTNNKVKEFCEVLIILISVHVHSSESEPLIAE